MYQVLEITISPMVKKKIKHANKTMFTKQNHRVLNSRSHSQRASPFRLNRIQK